MHHSSYGGACTILWLPYYTGAITVLYTLGAMWITSWGITVLYNREITFTTIVLLNARGMLTCMRVCIARQEVFLFQNHLLLHLGYLFLWILYWVLIYGQSFDVSWGMEQQPATLRYFQPRLTKIKCTIPSSNFGYSVYLYALPGFIFTDTFKLLLRLLGRGLSLPNDVLYWFQTKGVQIKLLLRFLHFILQTTSTFLDLFSALL